MKAKYHGKRCLMHGLIIKSMCRLKNLNWFAGMGSAVAFEEIIKIIKQSIEKGSKIFIGSDSFMSRKQVKFATAICLHGVTQRGRYFLQKNSHPTNHIRF